MPPKTPCRCGRQKMPGKRLCVWCWLDRQDVMVQVEYAHAREAASRAAVGFVERQRVPEAEWPAGTRWCSGCQGFVPLMYCRGSRCKAHESAAGHARMVAATYVVGLPDGSTRPFTGGDYDVLFAAQGGRCYVCGRRSGRRLAVDHDHISTFVRGLLCPDPDRGCNHVVLGTLEGSSVDGALSAARRLVAYLERPPAMMLR